MNVDIWEITARTQTVTALVLIVILLTYIAFRSAPSPSKKSHKTAKA